MHEGARERVQNWMKRNPAGMVGQDDASTRRQLFELGARKGLENVLEDTVPLDERAFRRADRTKSVACDVGVGALTMHIRRLEDKIEGLIGVVSGQNHNRSGIFGRNYSLGGVLLGQADESERFKGRKDLSCLPFSPSLRCDLAQARPSTSLNLLVTPEETICECRNAPLGRLECVQD